MSTGSKFYRDQINPKRLLRPASTSGIGWRVAVWFFLILTMLPMLALIWQAFGDSQGVWNHLIANVLPRSIWVTLSLLLGVGMGTFVLGSGTAWLISRYQFPFRGMLQWGLILPLAIPTYIAAYTWVEFAGYTGPLQGWIREIFGFASSRDYWFPDIRSTGGGIFLISLVLFPYVYLPARLSFALQSVNLLDVARVLGAGPWRLFLKVALPTARPAIAVGVILALMETLNDIGAVEYLGIRTLTFSVFDIWLNRSSLAGASQLALFLMAIIIILMMIERSLRRNQSYHDNKQGHVINDRVTLRGLKAFLVSFACLLPVVLGFGIPVAQMIHFTLKRPSQFSDPGLYSAMANTVSVAVGAAIICTLAGFVIVFTARNTKKRFYKYARHVAGFGYAVPGTILAIGVLTAMTGFDNWVSQYSLALFGIKTGLLISGTMAIVIFACSVRFLAIAIGNIEAGYAKISPNIMAAARTLGHSEGSALRQIEFPLISKALLVAGLLVIVETTKELSATILLRPFNFDTLSTYVYTRASRALFEEASLAALMIVMIGLIPVYVLTRVIISEQKQ